jgi:protein-L-isoaspartate(D-aspartate) O-methyltransferase
MWLVLLCSCGAENREPSAVSADPFTLAREQMIRHDLMGRGVRDPAVLSAMRRVPRHRFVIESWLDSAYDDTPLPIGNDQTISQPYIVAAMTELLGAGKDAVVLEVGTGSGYQAAVLAEIVREVYTIEIVEELARSAGQRLLELGYTNIFVKAGDGYAGWPEHAPFDGIVVTCGADHLPPPLIAQLKPGGRMVIPVGPAGDVQSLQVVTKRANGTFDTRDVMAVRFVPLTGEHGAKW